MGALGDTSKGRLSYLHLPRDSSTLKSPKLHSHPSITDPSAGNSRACRSGSRRKKRIVFPKFSRMGNFVSSLFKPSKKHNNNKKQRRKNKGSDLERYKELVEDSGHWKLGRSVDSTSTEDTFWVTKGLGNKQLNELVKLSSLECREAKKALVKEKEGLHELFPPLTVEEEEKVSYALRGRNRHELLVTHEASNIDITREVIRCLGCGAWLNDEVINLYLELLKEREKREPHSFLKCHFFNTFFYKKLISGKNGYEYNTVRRWTTKRKLGYGLIECDKIFVPIHRDIHWCLAVINIKDETFQYLDSLGGMDTTVLRLLARYFMDEVKDKSDILIDTSSWKKETAHNIPRQKNGFDCGMFMIKYIDFYSRGLGLHFSQVRKFPSTYAIFSVFSTMLLGIFPV